MACSASSTSSIRAGSPIASVTAVGWPRATLPMELLTEVLAGGLEVATQAGCPVIGGHSIDSPEPIYGMAVTGTADPAAAPLLSVRGLRPVMHLESVAAGR
mgnify:CR=1 FL=1